MRRFFRRDTTPYNFHEDWSTGKGTSIRSGWRIWKIAYGWRLNFYAADSSYVSYDFTWK